MKKATQSGQLRIIAGKWRGRKLAFPDVDGLRPTPDRVRETLFNWLQPMLGMADCIDLFAGSGALGFEAASRGAGNVTFIERDPHAVKQLITNCQMLTADNCTVENTTAQQFLTTTKQRFNIVFIDPPYQADLWNEVSALLTNNDILADNAMIYLESPSKTEIPNVPEQWQLVKDKQAGEVRYSLFSNNSRGLIDD